MRSRWHKCYCLIILCSCVIFVKLIVIAVVWMNKSESYRQERDVNVGLMEGEGDGGEPAGDREGEGDYGGDPARFRLRLRTLQQRLSASLGHRGQPATLTGEEKVLGDKSMKEAGINVVLSDRIPYDRDIPDVRDPACAGVKYGGDVLPTVSVIITFCEEPFSVLMRTLHSLLRTVARNYRNLTDLAEAHVAVWEPVKEVILVDDHSQRPHLHGQLEYYIQTRFPPDFVTVLRLEMWSGVMQARNAGARAASGEALVFLEAHCEPAPHWLPPLLHRLVHHPEGIVQPVRDYIHGDDFSYHAAPSIWVGDFTYDGFFRWINVPKHERKRLTSDIMPVRTAVMAGGVFAVMRRRYWEVGGYDEAMSGWGGDDIEMSFKMWMCGGYVEVIPCSRVGHVTRLARPYFVPPDVPAINIARVAEVWMDDYKEIYYLVRPDLRNNRGAVGEVWWRAGVRRRLGCRPFSWYLQLLCPDKALPLRDGDFFGRFRSAGSGQCVWGEGAGGALALRSCHTHTHGSHLLLLTHTGALLVHADLCAQPPTRIRDEDDTTETNNPSVVVTLDWCDWKKPFPEQVWRMLPTGQLQHSVTALCLTALTHTETDTDSGPLLPAPGHNYTALQQCGHPAPPHQQWQPQYTLDNIFEGSDIERKEALQRIRQSRVN